MSNGHANCALAVCCPPKSRQQKRALAATMAESMGGNPDDYQQYADWVVENFDLAPSGSLQEFKNIIARLARENP